MKKMFLLGALFAVGLGFTACSEKDAVENGTGQIPSGDSYVNLAINLPIAPGATPTRANDVFDDGLAKEYSVKDATLILFEGTNPSTAVYSGNYALNLSWDKVGETTDQITTTAQIVQKVNNRTAATNNFYAYVVLNKPAKLTDILTGATSSSTFSSLFGTTATLATTNLTETVDGTTNYIPMTNAPLAKYSGGSSAPTDGSYSVLSVIDKDLIFATEAEAQSHAATAVFVERMYAKATITNGSGDKIKDSNGYEVNIGTTEDPVYVNFDIQGWTLDNTNKSSYFQRQLAETFPSYTWYNYHSDHTSVTGNNVYRFAGFGEVASGKGYRIYWALDPNYDSYAASTFNLAETSSTFGAVGDANPQYCYENTFDVANQKEQSTTRALVKVQFNSGTTFYSINDDYKKFYTAETLKGKIIEFLMADPTIFAAAGTSGLSTPTVANSTIDLTETDLGQIKVGTTLTLGDASSHTLDCSSYATTINNLFNVENPSKHIKKYDNGISYYPILIKHFGNDGCYWASSEHLSTTSYADEGTAPVSRYLGRYGMVRNNWYSMNISKIMNLGSPTIPTPTTDDDDKVKSYISVEINILSWAKRTQDVDL